MEEMDREYYRNSKRQTKDEMRIGYAGIGNDIMPFISGSSDPRGRACISGGGRKKEKWSCVFGTILQPCHAGAAADHFIMAKFDIFLYNRK